MRPVKNRSRLRQHMFDLFVFVLFFVLGPSGMTFLLCVIPWPGPGLCNGGAF